MSNAGVNLQNAVIDYIFTGGGTLTPTLVNLFGASSSVFMSLHTSSPGEGGTQLTNEFLFTNGYARAPVPRQVGNTASGTPGYTVDGLTSTAKNSIATNFSPFTGGAAVAKYVGWGTQSSGAGVLIAYAPIVDTADDWFYLMTNQRPTAGTATGWVTAALNHLGSDPGLAQGDELAILKPYDDDLHTNLSAATPYFISSGTALEGAWDTGLGFKLDLTEPPTANPLVAAKCHLIQAIRVSGITTGSGIVPFIPSLGAIVVCV